MLSNRCINAKRWQIFSKGNGVTFDKQIYENNGNSNEESKNRINSCHGGGISYDKKKIQTKHLKNQCYSCRQKELIKIKTIVIQGVIFQGDVLFRFLFHLAQTLLSNTLKITRCLYNCYGRAVSRLLYMDGVKLYAKKDKQPKALLQSTWIY